MSTLRYADQAKSIVNSVKVNEDPFARTVRRLQEEVSRPTGRPGHLLCSCTYLSSKFGEHAWSKYSPGRLSRQDISSQKLKKQEHVGSLDDRTRSAQRSLYSGKEQ